MCGRILVVDDVATNRIMLKARLTAACYQVFQAATGQAAIDAAREHMPDLILLDAKLPDIDGAQVCRQLAGHATTKDIPIIMISAFGDEGTRLTALLAGARDFLVKPVDDKAVLARVRAALRHRDAVRELEARNRTNRLLGYAEGAKDLPFHPGTIAFVGTDRAALSALADQLPADFAHDCAFFTPTQVLSPAHQAKPADAYVLLAEPDQSLPDLVGLSELRARTRTRNAAILMVLNPDQAPSVPVALDLGADDCVVLPVGAQEMAPRLTRLVQSKQIADRLRRAAEQGSALALTDPLTGLYNRRYAENHLRQIADRAMQSGKPFAVMVVDLDLFKTINDTLGHLAGDEVLTKVAKRLRQSVRPSDLVARLGGEEFLIVLPETDPTLARKIAQRLRTHLADEPVQLGGREEVTITASVGLAMGPADGQTPLPDPTGPVLEAADKALYLSKASGRNMVTVGRTAA